MAQWIHDYSCGCIPELEEFCQEADKYIWQERDAATDLFVLCSDDKLSAHEVEMLEFKERGARSWLTRHYQGQAERGHCKDVDLETLSEPEADGV